MHGSVVILGVLILLAFALVGGPSLLTSVGTNEVAPEDANNWTLIEPTDGNSGFWPYLNSQPRFQKMSPINIVIVGETQDILRLLTESSGCYSWSRSASWQRVLPGEDS